MTDAEIANDPTLFLLIEAINLGRRDGMAGQHLSSMGSARDDLIDLRTALSQIANGEENPQDIAKAALDKLNS